MLESIDMQEVWRFWLEKLSSEQVVYQSCMRSLLNFDTNFHPHLTLPGLKTRLTRVYIVDMVVNVEMNNRGRIIMRNFWRVLDSNARAAISNNGCDFPQRIYPYVSLNYIPDHQKETQDNLNQWAKYALEFRGGTWKEEE